MKQAISHAKTEIDTEQEREAASVNGCNIDKCDSNDCNCFC